MNGGEVKFYFKGDTKDLDSKVKETSRLGDIIKGNLISTGITAGLGAIAGGIGTITGAMNNLVLKGGIDRALSIENAQFKLKGLGNSTKQVDKIMDNALSAVQGTAYGLDEAATVAASAVAAGVKPGKELERTLGLVADAAAISGRDMQSMGAIFNKVATSGKLQGEELNQFADAGIPIVQLLADTMGKTSAEIYDLASDGEIGFAQLQAAIEKGMGGAAQTMGQTFTGSLANLKAAFSRLGQDIMTPLLNGLTPALGNLTNIVDAAMSGETETIEKEVEKLGENLSKAVTSFADNLGPLLETLLPTFSLVLQTMIEKLPDFIESLLPVIITGLTTLIKSLITALPQILTLLVGMLPALISQLASMLPTITTACVNGFITIVEMLAQMAPVIIPQVVNALLEIIPILMENLPLFIEAGIQLLTGIIIGMVKSIPDQLKAIPKILKALVDGVKDYFGIKSPSRVFADIGEQLIKGLWNGIKSLGNWIVSNVKLIPSKILNAVKEKLNIKSLKTAGLDLIKGLWNGIKNAKDWVIGKVKGFGKSILDGLKNIFKEHSPSKATFEMGVNLDKGLINGVEDMKKDIDRAFMGTLGLSPNLYGSTSNHISPNINVTVNSSYKQDPLGQMVRDIKTFSGGAKNDYNYGTGV